MSRNLPCSKCGSSVFCDAEPNMSERERTFFLCENCQNKSHWITFIEGTTVSLPFEPNLVSWEAYKFRTCDLCQKEYDAGNFKHDNKDCIHCKKLMRICRGIWSKKK